MALKFSKSDESPKRPPPNYFSRPMQYKLLLLVGLLMTVLVLMYEAGKPENWFWMGFKQAGPGGEPLTKDEIADRDVDSRLPPSPNPDRSRPPGTIVVINDDDPAPPDEPSEDPAAMEAQDFKHRALVVGWKKLLDDSTPDDKTLLNVVLKAARDERALTKTEQAAWTVLALEFEQQWEQYHDQALQSVVKMKDEDKAVWLPALDAIKSAWQNRWQIAFQSSARGNTPLDAEKKSLAEVQSLVDEIALEAVRDNTIVSRIQEKDAWFRLADQLNTTDEAKLRDSSVGRVGYLQLFDQPATYRGKLVTIRGTAWLAYRVPAPENIYGIKHYYIFSLLPAGGPNDPVTIYSLETPPGFPTIRDRYLEGGSTDLREPVEFTGFFFKVCAYQSRDGIQLSPLMLAKTPRWFGTPATAQKGTPFPSWFIVAPVVVGLALLAVLVSTWVFLRSRGNAIVDQFARGLKEGPEHLRSLENVDITHNVGERLKKLSDEQ